MTQRTLLFDRPEKAARPGAIPPTWPPAEYRLPDTLEGIERGRQTDRPPPAKPPAAPFVRGSDTSEAAARDIGPKLGRLQTLVLQYIRQQGRRGATDPEIAEALELLSDTARARRTELRDRGLIRDAGDRRPTPRGKPATVWIALDY